jgi:hypothetical protein
MIGNIPFWVIPVAIMKSFVGAAAWSARGAPEALAEFQTFSEEFFPFLMRQPNDMPLHDFCDMGIKAVDIVLNGLSLKSDLMFQFGWLLKNTLSRQGNHDEAERLARSYRDWMHRWFVGAQGSLARVAAQRLAALGVQPTREAIAAAHTFGNAVYGVYNRPLRAVCVQLDVVCRAPHAETAFIETLLHEQIHAAIHHHMGDDPQRRELTWLEELAAVLTSQHAMLRAAERLDSGALLHAVVVRLKTQRARSQYGDLAEAIRRETSDSMVAWRAWQAIFALPPDKKRNYATEAVITPILHRAGWNVRLPYSYGNKFVTCFR